MEAVMRDERSYVFGEIPGVPQRFWRKILVSTEQFHEGTPCWIWMGARKNLGYGSAWVTKEIQAAFPGVFPRKYGMGAYRLMYCMAHEYDPVGLDIDHLCRNHPCVNPAHLEAVTRLENLRRGLGNRPSLQRQRDKTHCPQNHPYDEENTRVNYVNGSPQRDCRACDRDQKRVWLQRLKAEDPVGYQKFLDSKKIPSERERSKLYQRERRQKMREDGTYDEYLARKREGERRRYAERKQRERDAG
jgi:hypothetical protein